MKVFLKIAAVALAAVLLLCGCNTAGGGTADAPAGDAPAAQGGDYTGLLLSPDTLVIGTSPDYPPYESYEGENIVGFDIELMEAVGKIMGLTIEWSPMEFDTILMALTSGQVDAGVSGFTYDEDRAASGILFSSTYLASAQVAFVAEDSDIQTIDDFHGKNMYSSLGTTGAQALKDLEFDDMEVTEGTDFQTAFQMLGAGQIDGVVCDRAVGQSFIDNGFAVRAVEEPLLDEENMVTFAPGKEAVRDAVNAALEEYMKSADYTALRTKYGF